MAGANHLKTALVYLRLGRVSNVPTIWTNCMAGLILAGASPNLTVLALTAASISLLYVAGMFLNDAFDQEFDRRYRPERPIPSGEISGAAVYAVGFLLMAAGLVILLLSFSRSDVAVSGILLAALIVLYDWSHKRMAASPVLMAACRAMVYFVAAAVAGRVMGPEVIGGAAVLTAYMIGLSYVAKQENLTEIQNLWPLVLLAAPFIYSARGIIYFIFLGWVVFALSFLFRKPKNIPRCVVSLIAGISLLDGLLIASVAPQTVWSWMGVGGFVLTILFQRWVPGT